MLIDAQFPQAVAARAALSTVFVQHALKRGLTQGTAEDLLAVLPVGVGRSECFLDRVTNLWRYEFGRPFTLAGGALLGPHVWQPVRNLVAVTACAARLLGKRQLAQYMARLGYPDKHEEVLVEFLPAIRLASADTQAEFEVLTGVGNRDVDWRFRRAGAQPVLMDVKRRIADLLSLAERTMRGERRSKDTAPQPNHDPALLFRSVEKKLPRRLPDEQLQGAWIVTALRQEATELRAAFDALDASRVHFAVLGGWEPGVRVLTRRVQDEAQILRLFGEHRVQDAWEFTRVRLLLNGAVFT